MSDVASQKRIAASIMKCGVNRVWFDPARLSDIENAISREDLKGTRNGWRDQGTPEEGRQPRQGPRTDRPAVLRAPQGCRKTEGCSRCPQPEQDRMGPEDPCDQESAR